MNPNSGPPASEHDMTIEPNVEPVDDLQHESSSQPPAERFGFPFFIVTVILAALLCFTGLHNRALWQDEAETAVLARRVLTTGMPKALENDNLILQEVPGYNNNFTWTFHPWAQFYLAAVSMKCFGASPWALRLPFAVCGVLTVALLYIFVWQHWRNRYVALLAATLLLGSATFIVHARQCRYYALSALACLLVVIVFFEIIRRTRPFWWILCAMALTFQFYADFGTLAAITPGLFFSLFIMKADRPAWRRMTKALLLATILCAPGILLHWDRLTGSDGSRFEAPATLLAYLAILDGWFVPLIILLPAAVILIWRWSDEQRAITPSTSVAFSCGLMVFFAAGVMSRAAPAPQVRYLIPQMSLAKLVLAAILFELFRQFKSRNLPTTGLVVVTTAALALIVANVFATPLQIFTPDLKLHRAPDYCTETKPYLRFEFPGLLHEIMHDWIDPNRVSINIVNDLARSGDRVLTNYGDLPIMFARPDLTVYGEQGGSARPPWAGGPPDLVILRHHFPASFMEQMKDLTEKGAYVAVRISVSDMVWSNNPEPKTHHFAKPDQMMDHWVFLRREFGARFDHLPTDLADLTQRWSMKNPPPLTESKGASK